MGKPPTTDQELTARVAALEADMAEVQAQLETHEQRLVTQQTEIDDLMARVTAQEQQLVDAIASVTIELNALNARVTALEAGTTPPDPGPDPEPEPPPAGTMLATLTIPAQGTVTEGVYTFSETDAAELDDWDDPRGAFGLGVKQATNPDLPYFRVRFVRSHDGQWASVEFWYGDGTAAAPVAHMGIGYTVTVTGDFATTTDQVTPYHWWGSRWRLSGNAANGLQPGRHDWPYADTPYDTLVAEKLIPKFDPTQSGRAATVSNVRPYTPMGSGSLATDQGATGLRPEIGLFSEWEACYVACLAPGASPELQALTDTHRGYMESQVEVGGSMPIWLYDPEHGCQYDMVHNRPGQYPLAQPNPQTWVPFNASGPPGAVLASKLSDTNGMNWGVPEQVIPDGGTITNQLITVDWGGYAYGPMPTGQPIVGQAGGTMGDARITYSWGDEGYQAGNLWKMDSSHQGGFGYLAWLLIRDPWDLFTVQAMSISHIYSPQGFNNLQARQTAWDYARAAQAYVATPAEGLPRWMLPKATLEQRFRHIQNWIIDNNIAAVGGNNAQAGAPPGYFENMRTVFHSLGASNLSQGGDQTGTHGCGWQISGFMKSWQEAYFAQAHCFAAICAPSELSREIAEWFIENVDARYNGTSGYAKGAWAPYDLPYRAQPAPNGGTYANPIFSSWAEVWNESKRYNMNGYDGINACGSWDGADPTDLVAAYGYGGGNWDYLTTDLAALTLAVQAGVLPADAADEVIACAKALYGAEFYQRCYATQ